MEQPVLIRVALISLIGQMLMACVPAAIPPVPVSVSHSPLYNQGHCSSRFVAHDLPHVTAAAVDRVAYFISNGAGLAANDLDQDGDIDLVLANLFGPNHIFWNEGGWHFRPEVLFQGSARAVTIVDVDGDGWLDIIFTMRIGSIRFWRNTSTGNQGNVDQFAEERLPGIQGYAYAMNWGDLDADGDLDLVTASYDASLEKQLGEYALQASGQAGVYVYENESGSFVPTRLTTRSQALALQLFDVDRDGRLDIIVGNDFDVPDQVWLSKLAGWELSSPFPITTHSTMSFEAGDVNNDGSLELFAADMHPYSVAPEIMNQWQPVYLTAQYDFPRRSFPRLCERNYDSTRALAGPWGSQVLRSFPL